MDKFIGFDIDHKHTMACVVQSGQPDRYRKLPTDLASLREWLKTERGPGHRVHLTFEVSGLSGWLYGGVVDVVDRLEVSNPTKLTWIYRTAKKNDRIGARKHGDPVSPKSPPVARFSYFHASSAAASRDTPHRQKKAGKSC